MKTLSFFHAIKYKLIIIFYCGVYDKLNNPLFY